MRFITDTWAGVAFFLWLIFMVIGFAVSWWNEGHFAVFLWAAVISAVVVGIMVFLARIFPSRDWEP